MTITLSDNYIIETDPFNYILKEFSISQKGKNAGTKVARSLGYYGTLKQALYGYMHYVLLTDTEAVHINSICEYIEKIESRLLGALEDKLGGADE